MSYTDNELQEHELNFWVNGYTKPFPHKDFYESFFNFNELAGARVVDIGCGGAPITEYCGVDGIDLTIVDPLIGKLVETDKYKHLGEYDYFAGSLFDFKKTKYDYVVCLNVVDHFNDPEYTFVDKFSSMLKPNAELWLYYDLRSKDDGDHLMINESKIMEKITENFRIVRISDTTNPTHAGWSSVFKSVRLVAKKK